ncbi:hypothetical protein HF086_000356 [Spodoptera exigua]|uniref:MADF domain-containing protein n=1 Tax=Spodoptera exigua TaxID=7107 RepID=A0A922MAA6_SPOEX|nr:hypothetical protein HF086_000356 [Spodoptera exigua]
MANNITPEVLIPLVEQRAVLWDKTLDVYKDKGLKLAAWREICCVFEPNFDKLEEKERKDFVTEPRMTSDSSNEPNNSISDTLSDAAPSTQKKTKTDTLDDKMSQFLDYKLNNQEHPHVSFIKGILPSLASFDNDDNFEFQTGVKFRIVTNCSGLRQAWLKRDISPRIVRWCLDLQEYNFEVDHTPGCTMAHVDALSRNPLVVQHIKEKDLIEPLQEDDEEIQKNILNLKLEQDANNK